MDRVEKKIIDDFLNEGSKLAAVLEPLEGRHLVRLLRRRLFLSQRELAKRAKIAQSTIARIENGQLEPTEKILRKLLISMECDMLIVPLPRHFPDDILRAKAEKIAKKRIKYLEGTMALEKQKPEKKWLDEMIEKETEELLRSPSKIWSYDG